jgi:hypothetical protein
MSCRVKAANVSALVSDEAGGVIGSQGSSGGHGSARSWAWAWLVLSCGANDPADLFRPLPTAELSSISAAAACGSAPCTNEGDAGAVSNDALSEAASGVDAVRRDPAQALLKPVLASADAGSSGAAASSSDAGSGALPGITSVVTDAGATAAACSGVFAESCYRVSTGPAPWFTAEADCEAWGGHLAFVDSQQEDVFIGGLLSVNVWLGTLDKKSEFGVWLDDSPVLFSNWGPNQPDVYPSQDCLEKREVEGEPWFDQPCETSNWYVCERAL